MDWLSRKETNLMCDGPLFPNFKILLVVFDCVLFLTLIVYQRKTLYLMLECVLVA